MWVAEAVNSFRLFISNLGPDYRRVDHNLAAFLKEWVEGGDAVAVCAGDYSMFLRGVILIIERLRSHPDEFGGWAERMEAVARPDAPLSLPEILDPDWWAFMSSSYERRSRQA